MELELEQKLSTQVKLQAWFVGLFLLYIIGIVLIIAGQGTPGIIVIGAIIILGAWIARLVLWILGIINAASIQKITNDSVTLVVFSVITFWIAGIIMAVVERNKYKKKNYSIFNNDNIQDNNGSVNN